MNKKFLSIAMAFVLCILMFQHTYAADSDDNEMPDEIYVTNADELIAALGSDRVITLADGVYVLYKTCPDGDSDFYDTLSIEEMYNLTLRAEHSGMAEILSSEFCVPLGSIKSGSRSVIEMSDARNITLEGLRIGRTSLFYADASEIIKPEFRLFSGDDPKYISAPIVSVYNGQNITIKDCDLYKGQYGISFSGRGLNVIGTTIRDNCEAAVYAGGSDISFSDCVVSGNGYEAVENSEHIPTYECVVNAYDVTPIVFENCIFINNSNTLFAKTEGNATTDNCTFKNNVWQSEEPMAYGICHNGITWQIVSDNENPDGEILSLGYPIELNDYTFDSATGEVLPYTAHAFPWDNYSYSNLQLAPDVSFDDTIVYGMCAPQLKWQLDKSTKTLTISGIGMMYGESVYTVPWKNYYDEIEHIEVDDKVEALYGYSFTQTAFYSNAANWDNGVLYIGKHLIQVNGNTEGTVDVRDNTISVSHAAFSNCSKLMNIILPSSITRMDAYVPYYHKTGNGVFSGCSSLRNITIPKSIVEFGTGDFYRCDTLSDIYYGGTIDEWNKINIATLWNDALDNANIHCTDGNIGAPTPYAYSIEDDYAVITGCSSNVYEVEIPAEIEGYPVKMIGMDAFKNCYNLRNIKLPDSIIYIDYRAFEDTALYKNDDNWEDGLFYIDKYFIRAKDGVKGNIKIKEGTEVIGAWALWRCGGFTGITIPDSVKYVNDGAFSYCTSLTEIVFPPDAEIESGEVFYGDSSLINLTLPYLYESGRLSLYGCDKIQNVFITDKNQSFCDIDGVVYTKDRTHLIYYPIGRTQSSYTIPDGVQYIAAGAFNGSSIESLTLPQSIRTVEEEAIYSAYGLKDVYYKGTKDQWESLEIKNYNNSLNDANVHGEDFDIILPVITYEESDDGSYYIITSVKKYAEEVTIPAEYNGKPVSDISDMAFDGCRLKAIHVENGSNAFSELDGVLYTKDMMTLIKYPALKENSKYTIPAAVTQIGSNAFAECENINDVVISEGITSIGVWAFASCPLLKSVSLPSSVTEIPIGAFNNCNSLIRVGIGKNVTHIASFAFEGCDNLMSIYYDGNRWSSIIKENYNTPLNNANVKLYAMPDTAAIEYVSTGKYINDSDRIYIYTETSLLEDAIIIAAGYDETGAVIDIVDITDYTNGKIIGRSAEISSAAKSVKVFAWDSLEGMNPQCEAESTTVE